MCLQILHCFAPLEFEVLSLYLNNSAATNRLHTHRQMSIMLVIICSHLLCLCRRFHCKRFLQHSNISQQQPASLSITLHLAATHYLSQPHTTSRSHTLPLAVALCVPQHRSASCCCTPHLSATHYFLQPHTTSRSCTLHPSLSHTPMVMLRLDQIL